MKTYRNQILPLAPALALLLLAAPATIRADILFVTDYNSGVGSTIEEFDTSSGADLGAFASSGLDNPTGLALDGAGNLYAANNGNNTIEEFNSSGAGTVFASSGLNQPIALAFNKAGSLFVANQGNNTVEKFNSSGAGTAFTGVNNPGGLACDNAGNLYASQQNGFIVKVNSAGVRSFFPSGLNQPLSMACDSAGNLYVDYYNYVANSDSIEKFNSSGTDLGLFASGLSDSYNSCLAFDSAGNLFVAGQYNNTIEELSSSGADLGVFASGVIGPVGLAIEPAPEPSTWVLLAVGLIVTLWRGGYFQRRMIRSERGFHIDG